MLCPPWPELVFIIPNAFLGWQILLSSHVLMAWFLGNWYWQWRILGQHDGRCWVSEKLKNSPIFQAFWDCGEGRRKTTECNRKQVETCATGGDVKGSQGRGKRSGPLRLMPWERAIASFLVRLRSMAELLLKKPYWKVTPAPGKSQSASL